MPNAPKQMPLYQQIYDDIKEAIKDGTYETGSQIPSEAELSREYSVSRITVRRAVEDLCADGYLIKQQGRGTFVGAPHLQRRLQQERNTRTFTQFCEENGVRPGGHVLEMPIVPARPHECRFFGIPEGSLLIYIHRARTADGLPMCEENVFIPYEGAKGLLAEQLEDASLFDAIARVTGRRVVSNAEWVVSAVKATTEQASNLSVAPGDPLLCTNVRFTDDDDKPICIGRQYFVGSRYELSI